LVRAGRLHGYTYDQVSVSPVTADRPPEVQQSLREGRVVTVSGGDGGGSETVLAVPVSVRGEAIGVLDIRKSEEAGEWTPEELLLAERVSDQLALALENARLLEDSQSRAAREQLVGQMTAQFTRSLDMEAVLRTAVRELGQLPQVAEVAVHVVSPEASPAASKGEEA
ncbi:MAG: GAF domain-containing protein, partial [Chloroflexota bacterium]|nr:GAF domain-containing protein [Chloroflexota bacterium]